MAMRRIERDEEESGDKEWCWMQLGIHPNHHFLNSGTCSSLEWTLEFKSSSLQPLYFIKFVLLLKK